jgi:hypothetical protein
VRLAPCLPLSPLAWPWRRGERSEGPEAMVVQSKVGVHVAEDPRDLAPIIMDDD